MRAIRAVLPGMLERGSGAIVNVNSVNAIVADPLVLDYSASKAALASVAKALSQELGAEGDPDQRGLARPGGDRPLARQGRRRGAGRGGGRRRRTRARSGRAPRPSMATGRFTTPQEVAAQVLLLASPLSGNVTGSHAVIDGGLTKAT